MAADDELTLTIHGLLEYNAAVDGEVFAVKFQKFIRGLAAADKAANGSRRLKFMISDLSKNTATASVKERPTQSPGVTKSGVDYYVKCVTEIYNDTDHARTFDRDVVRNIADLNSGVGDAFAFGEIKQKSTAKIIRIDQFLQDRAKRVLSDIDRAETGRLPFYKGRAYGTFDGELRLLDALEATDRAILLLTAGGEKIECIVGPVDQDKVRHAWRRRCRVTGTAHYDGEGGLPVRIDAVDIEVVEPGTGLARWRGAFKGLSADEGWED
jgi:hypothetical protein